MTSRRTLLWVWIVGSVCWVAWWIWHYATTCSLNKMSGGWAITCRWQSAEAGGMAVVARTAPALMVLWDMAAKTIGIPLYALIAGVVVLWVIERVRAARPGRVGKK